MANYSKIPGISETFLKNYTDTQYVIVQKPGLNILYICINHCNIMKLPFGQIHNKHWYYLLLGNRILSILHTSEHFVFRTASKNRRRRNKM
jgi:hypothetical protein